MFKFGIVRVVITLLMVVAISWSVAHGDQGQALIEAVAKNDVKQVKLLLDKGADVNTKNKDGVTVLMMASVEGQVDVVKLLLDKGADVNAKNKDGVTALVVAIARGNVDAMRLILDKGADVNAKNKDGATPLVVAIVQGNVDAVRLLLEKGAEINAKYEGGATVLMIAAGVGQVEVVKLLLAKGADVNAKDKDGMTALNAASQKGHTKVLELLKAHVSGQKKGQSQDNRQVWEHTDRQFKDQGNRIWIETDRHGEVLFTFTEIDRNSDFIEIQDSSRGYTVRLYGNAMYIKGGNRSDLKKFDDFTKYYDGKWSAIPSDQAKAHSLLLKKAEQGDALAQVDLGLAYERGKGVPQDYDEAVKRFRTAADQGHARGQYNLARMYANGQGVERDYQKAFDLYRKSADQGNGNAQNNLGIMYKNGYGVPKDHKEAVTWYRKSADQGNRWAQYNLGRMYQHGTGVTEDGQEALKWYQKAAAQGHEEAKKALSRIQVKSGPGKSEVQRPDFGGDHSFSYVPPSGWKLVEVPDASDYKIAHGEIVQGFGPNISVIAGESSKSLDLVAVELMASAKAKHKGFAFLEKSDFTTSDGLRGIKLAFESDAPSGMVNKRLRHVHYYFNAGAKAFVAACWALAADGKKHDPAFDSAMKTFRIKTSGETRSPDKQGE